MITFFSVGIMVMCMLMMLAAYMCVHMHCCQSADELLQHSIHNSEISRLVRLGCHSRFPLVHVHIWSEIKPVTVTVVTVTMVTLVLL